MQENDILKELRIPGLEHGPHADECMENTRQNILAEIQQWCSDVSAPNILWLKGYPGVGKSAIAASLVKQLRASTRLGSYFFFQRQRAAEMTPSALWRTVAYDLARAHLTVRRHLVAKLKEKEIDLSTVNITDLFRNLIHEPLVASQDIPSERLPVVVLDALDECGGLAGQHSDHRKRLMQTLEMWSQLPGKFKLVISSRDERDIKRVFSRTRHDIIDIPAGQTVDSQSSNDIRVFLEDQFEQMTGEYETLPPGWPGPQIIQDLSGKADGLFIWAKTVVSFISQRTPKRRLEAVLSGGGLGTVETLSGMESRNMGTLYSQILASSFHQQSPGELKAFRSLVGTVIRADGTLTLSSIAQLLSIDDEMVEHVFRGLQSVMDYHDILRFNHQSFVDFLLNPVACPPEFRVDVKQVDAELSLRCLTTMTTTLKFNICELESSYLSNVEVRDLKERIRQEISGALQYSCIHWSRHLCSDWDPAYVDIGGALDKFLKGEWPLYWLEVLSVMEKVPAGIRALRQVKVCPKVSVYCQPENTS